MALLKNNWADWDGTGTPPVGTVYTSAAANAVANAVNADSTALSSVTSPLLGANQLIGNDSTDNTTALAALLNDSTIHDLYFPAGIYRYSNVDIFRTTPLRIWGPGTLRSTLSTTSTATAFTLLGSNITIQDLTFDYVTPIDITVTSWPFDPVILFIGDHNAGEDQFNITVDNVTLREARWVALFTQRANNLRITNCTVENCLSAGIMVNNNLSPGPVIVDNNYVYNTGDDCIWVGNVASVTGGLPMPNVTVTNNHCELSDAKGIGIGGIVGGVVSGNVIKNTYTPGIQMIAGSFHDMAPNHDVIITDNVVIDGGKNHGAAGRHISATVSSVPNGIQIDGAGNTNITVSNNTVVGSQQLGIYVEQGVNFVVSDNTVIDSGADGIFAGNIPDADYDRFTDLAIDGNTVINSVVGMRVGSVDGLAVRNNYLRSFNVGDTTTTYGILYGWVKNASITGNHLINDDAADFTIFENPGTTNPFCEVGPNTEVITSQADKNVRSLTTINGHRIGFGSAAPTTGTWLRGDIIINTTVVGFGNIGWICRTGGTPGTWHKWGISQLAGTYDLTTWDPASIATGASTSTTVTITDGAVIGDIVTVGHSAAVPAGCILSGAVTATNTVTVTLFNASGSTVNVASGTLTVIVFRAP